MALLKSSVVRAGPLSYSEGKSYRYSIQWHSRWFSASNFVATVWGKTLSCFSMTMPPCTKLGPYRNSLSRSVWKNLTGLPWPQPHQTPLGWIGMPTVSQDSTSVPNLTNALVAEWKQVPAAMFQYLVESLPRRVGAVIATKGGPTPY